MDMHTTHGHYTWTCTLHMDMHTTHAHYTFTCTLHMDMHIAPGQTHYTLTCKRCMTNRHTHTHPNTNLAYYKKYVTNHAHRNTSKKKEIKLLGEFSSNDSTEMMYAMCTVLN